jgi:5-methylcytosine-specific restriction endonuclease McrA
MMRRLERCGQDPILDFDAIVESKHDGKRVDLLRMLRSRVQQAYQAYSGVLPALEKLVALNLQQHERAALLHCYEARTVPLDKMKNRIMNMQSPIAQSICQYCGIDTPYTSDHYMPRSRFAEFAVYSQNLLPCCNRCNELRKDNWLDDGGQRRVFHLYFDEIDETEPLLFAELDFSEEVPAAIFRLDSSRVRDMAFFQRFSSHVEQLDLLKRFRRAACRRLFDLHDYISRKKLGQAAEEIEVALKEELESEQYKFGIHSWRVALLRAILATSQFVDFSLTRPIGIWAQREARS